ncbi:hypothetical protein QJS10_CPA09g01792 [Acorus calamus]|uniref:Uncharacterized protein n=1 Tax=Acorus calamus TaxID=4465 RepID=A0AAV9E4W4_ACOCL|nr:hypothetical protein QJS10_CPA09g01792 [Acorus calamus]
MRPTRRFPVRMSWVRFLQDWKVSVIAPVRRLFSRSSSERYLLLQSSEGIKPISPLLPRLRYVTEEQFPSSSGIPPWNSLEAKRIDSACLHEPIQ